MRLLLVSMSAASLDRQSEGWLVLQAERRGQIYGCALWCLLWSDHFRMNVVRLLCQVSKHCQWPSRTLYELSQKNDLKITVLYLLLITIILV